MKNIIKNTIHLMGAHMMLILLTPTVMNIILIGAYFAFGWENFIVINAAMVLNMLAMASCIAVVTETIITSLRDNDECDQ